MILRQDFDSQIFLKYFCQNILYIVCFFVFCSSIMCISANVHDVRPGAFILNIDSTWMWRAAVSSFTSFSVVSCVTSRCSSTLEKKASLNG